MLDLAVVGGTVVDGTGAAPVRADVGVRDGRIVAVGPLDEPAARTVDATDLVVAPGFIDLHTHYDAQAFWDTTLSPSPLHGVTTVIGGNCGFTIAPLTDDASDADYLMRMLAKVEGMPLESLIAGVPWDWRTTAEYLDRLDGTLLPNAGFLVGHSTMRRVAMREDAVGRPATPEQLEQMKQLLADGLRAGALGFSSSWSITHSDHNGDPVPSRYADEQEMLALCAVLREHEGTVLEFIPGAGAFSQEAIDLMAHMSATADRPLNWNTITVYTKNTEVIEHQLAASDRAEALGGRVVALAMADSLRARFTFETGFGLDALPGWGPYMALPAAEKLALLRDPAQRAHLDALARSATTQRERSIAHWRKYLIGDTHSAATKQFEGRPVGEIATQLGTSPWDALIDIVVADDLRTGFYAPDPGQDDATWERRVEVWRDPRVLVGASDAGAHLDMIESFGYTTTLLGKTVRERHLMPIEEGVRMLTSDQAHLYGLKDRGELRQGFHADLVVLDPDRIGPGQVLPQHDLPGGALRITGGAVGIEHVFVNGTEVVTGTECTDARPGRLLRSGRDTYTVHVS